MKKIIGHLDMDAFFASVEEVTTKRFLGKPIVVGSPIIDGVGRGVVSTANYKAREYGIHSAMPISVAWKLSQDAKKQGKDEVIFLPVDFELYHKVSHHVEEIIKTHAEIVEQASVDEFYFDLTFIGTYKKAEALCKKIKQEILVKERVTCSVGIGPNKLIAKIAAGMQKPDGLVVVPDDKVQNFLRPLKVRELPGIGPKTEEFLHKKNIMVVNDLLPFSKEELREMMGKHGESVYDKARGIDESPIAQFHAAKSIGEQTTFSKNSLEPVFVHGVLQKLAEHVFLTFAKSDFVAFKTITITVRFSDFETKTSSKSFKEGIGKSGKKKFEIEVLWLVLPFLDKRSNPRRKLIRLIGVRVEKLMSN